MVTVNCSYSFIENNIMSTDERELHLTECAGKGCRRCQNALGDFIYPTKETAPKGLNPSAQLEAIEKIINEAKKKTKGLSPDERDGSFSSVVKAMEIMTARSRALHAIEKLIKDNDAYDISSRTTGTDQEDHSGNRGAGGPSGS